MVDQQISGHYTTTIVQAQAKDRIWREGRVRAECLSAHNAGLA